MGAGSQQYAAGNFILDAEPLQYIRPDNATEQAGNNGKIAVIPGIPPMAWDTLIAMGAVIERGSGC